MVVVYIYEGIPRRGEEGNRQKVIEGHRKT